MPPFEWIAKDQATVPATMIEAWFKRKVETAQSDLQVKHVVSVSPEHQELVEKFVGCAIATLQAAVSFLSLPQVKLIATLTLLFNPVGFVVSTTLRAMQLSTATRTMALFMTLKPVPSSKQRRCWVLPSL
jgi:hypothetical protein